MSCNDNQVNKFYEGEGNDIQNIEFDMGLWNVISPDCIQHICG